MGGAVKFAVPTVANGKVYVGVQQAVDIFGLTTILPMPVIVDGPVVTNALCQLGDLTVVVVGETNIFRVAATGLEGQPLSYQWQFGDGAISAVTTQSLTPHAYTAGCGPYAGSVTVSNSQGVVSHDFAVAVACDLDLRKPQGKLTVALNFATLNRDSAQLTARLVPAPTMSLFSPAGLKLVADIGGVQVDYILDAKGRGVNDSSNCRLAQKKSTGTRAGYWTLTVKLNRGSWRDTWTEAGLINATIPGPGQAVTVPVVIAVGDNAFAARPTLSYTATAGKSGKAK